MRIRSIKPEFWRSQDISSLSVEDRLFFIGVWSYVDDNGVGEDRVPMISADLFADDIERDPSETFARVSRGLLKLAEQGLITRYEVDGRSYLRVVNWQLHQRIDKPNKARFPFENGVIAKIFDESAEPSRDTPETLATSSRLEGEGEGEQGNKGTGEGEAPPPRTCRKHSHWEHDEKCRACGRDRQTFETWQKAEARKPRPLKPHEHRWLTDGTCISCEAVRDD